MTKKDYIALAIALRSVKLSEYTGDKDSMEYFYYDLEAGMWRTCVRAIMEACAKGNATFNRNKFVTACGLPNMLD